MKSVTGYITFSLLQKILAVSAFLFLALLLSSTTGNCAIWSKEKNKDTMRFISFSPDGKKILFDRTRGDGNRMVNVYDLESGELSAYRSPIGEEWACARYSMDGKSIVFATIPYDGKHWDTANSQIAVMSPNGDNIKRITTARGFKVSPSFSHNGQKVIYVRAGKIRTEGKTPAADYDIYEVDLTTGTESRVTWFKFFMMSSPYYFPGDERIIFSAFGPPKLFPGIAENDYKAIQKKREDFNAKRKQYVMKLADIIYIVKKGQKELPVPLIESKDLIRMPLLSQDGMIFFLTQAYKPDGTGDRGQYFRYSADGKHQRITNLHSGIWSSAVSNNSEFLAIVYGSRDINRIVIFKVKDGSSREIVLPDKPSRIINQ